MTTEKLGVGHIDGVIVQTKRAESRSKRQIYLQENEPKRALGESIMERIDPDVIFVLEVISKGVVSSEHARVVKYKLNAIQGPTVYLTSQGIGDNTPDQSSKKIGKIKSPVRGMTAFVKQAGLAVNDGSNSWELSTKGENLIREYDKKNALAAQIINSIPPDQIYPIADQVRREETSYYSYSYSNCINFFGVENDPKNPDKVRVFLDGEEVLISTGHFVELLGLIQRDEKEKWSYSPKQ